MSELLKLKVQRQKKTLPLFAMRRCLKISCSNYNAYISVFNNKMVRLLGFEPRTSWSVAKRSIQLSYRRIIFLYQKIIVLIKFNIYKKIN